jgi:hypothetical protein
VAHLTREKRVAKPSERLVLAKNLPPEVLAEAAQDRQVFG